MLKRIKACYNRLLDYKTQILQSMEDFLDQCLLEIWEFINFQMARLFRTIFFVFWVLILACAVINCCATFITAFAQFLLWLIHYFNMSNFILHFTLSIFDNIFRAIIYLEGIATYYDYQMLEYFAMLDKYTPMQRYMFCMLVLLLLYLLVRWLDNDDDDRQ